MGLIEYLFFRPGPPGEVFNTWGAVLLGVYIGLALGLLLLGRLGHLFTVRHGFHRTLLARVVRWGLLLQAAGVVIIVVRLLNWPVVSARIWLWVQIAAEVVAAGFLWSWLRQRYRGALASYELDERRRTYLPPAAGGTLVPARRRTARKR